MIVNKFPFFSGGGTLISFTIDNGTYQAEAGMTWAEWVSSTYNTMGYRVNGSRILHPNGYYIGKYGIFGEPVRPSNSIINGQAYMLDRTPE